MATESIGALIPTAIPGYADAADIQAALRAYHYGSYSYDPANTSAGSLVTPSMAKTIYDIQQDIIDLENRPSSGGEVNTTQPVPGDFTPPQIPDGFIWVDQDGVLGGQPTGATAVFTNSAPTSNITTGTIWVDKDATTVLDNPYIPQGIINAKGDLIVGSGDDDATVLTAASTNGWILSANSSTATGLEWIANDQGDITAVTSGTGISVTSSTGPIPSVAIDTAVVATTNNTLTMSGKTLTSPTINTPTISGGTAASGILIAPEERWNIVASAATGTIAIDALTSGVWYYTSNATANHTLNFRGSATTSMNTILTTGDAITVLWLVTNGATPYYPNVYQVDGTTSGVTVNWSGGTAPSAGNASGIDVYSFTIVKTANATFRILAAGAVKYA